MPVGVLAAVGCKGKLRVTLSGLRAAAFLPVLPRKHWKLHVSQHLLCNMYIHVCFVCNWLCFVAFARLGTRGTLAMPCTRDAGSFEPCRMHPHELLHLALDLVQVGLHLGDLEQLVLQLLTASFI
jgi:hypothetical protein